LAVNQIKKSAKISTITVTKKKKKIFNNKTTQHLNPFAVQMNL